MGVRAGTRPLPDVVSLTCSCSRKSPTLEFEVRRPRAYATTHPRHQVRAGSTGCPEGQALACASAPARSIAREAGPRRDEPGNARLEARAFRTAARAGPPAVVATGTARSAPPAPWSGPPLPPCGRPGRPPSSSAPQARPRVRGARTGKSCGLGGVDRPAVDRPVEPGPSRGRASRTRSFVLGEDGGTSSRLHPQRPASRALLDYARPGDTVHTTGCSASELPAPSTCPARPPTSSAPPYCGRSSEPTSTKG